MQTDRVWGFPGGRVAVLDDEDRHPIQLCLLGSFRLLRRGQVVDVRSGGKTEALLELLGLAARQGIPRETLLGRLWPDSEASLAGNALNNLVHTLRGLLADALDGASPVIHAAGFYRLNYEAGVAVDVTQFKSLVARSERLGRVGDQAAAAELAERAVNLYRGDLRAGRQLRGADDLRTRPPARDVSGAVDAPGRLCLRARGFRGVSELLAASAGI